VDVVGAAEENLVEPLQLFSFMSFMESEPTGEPEVRMMMAPEETDDTDPPDLLPSTQPAWLKRFEQGMNPNELALFQAVAAAAGLSIAQAQFASHAYAGDAQDEPAVNEQTRGDAHAPFHAKGDGLAHYGLPSNLQDLVSDLPKPDTFDHGRPRSFDQFDGHQFGLRNRLADGDSADHREANGATQAYRRDDDDSGGSSDHSSKHVQQEGHNGDRSGAHDDGARTERANADAPCGDIDLSGFGPLIDMSGLPALGAFGKASSHHASLHETALPRLENVIDFTRDLFSDGPFAHSGGQASGVKPDGFAAQGHHPHADSIAPVDIMHQIAADMEAVAHHAG
jgi:hypothetical protein